MSVSNKMPPKVKPTFYTVGSLILCVHKGTKYEAKILDVKDADTSDPTYVIHYQGWNSRYDESVKHSESAEKIFEATPEARAEAKRIIGNVQTSTSSKKRKSRIDNVTDDEFRKSESGSRGSSPSVSSVKGLKTLKRKATDSPAIVVPEKPTIEINVSLPKALRQFLVDDSDLIDKNQLLKLPARFTVDDIIEDYRASIGTEGDQMRTMDEMYVEYENDAHSQVPTVALVCSALGLTDYFNNLLSQHLLYKFERPQYQELVEKEKVVEKPTSKKSRKSGTKEPTPPASVSVFADDDFRPSKYYGFMHLLRLVSKIPVFFKMAQWHDYALKNATTSLHDFIVFLNKNHEKYFDSAIDYEVASTDYYRLTHQP